jgi:ribonuclease D
MRARACADALDSRPARTQLRPASFVDLAVVAGLFRYSRVGLKGMAAAFGVEIAKSKNVQLSNWETVPLRLAQVAYAAQDAALGLWLLHRLHGAHARDVPLADWAGAFLDVPSLTALLADRDTAHGPLGAAARDFVTQQAAAATERAAMLVDRRCRTAMAMGTADATRSLAALQDIAKARAQRLTWHVGAVSMPPAAGASASASAGARFAATCALDGAPLARGAGRTHSLARRAAAVAALRVLAAQAAQVDALGVAAAAAHGLGV